MGRRILVVHNAYKQHGGEDSVVAAEISLLRSHGDEVETLFRDNNDVDGMSAFSLMRETVWSSKTQQDLMSKVSQFRPDLIHAHNTFPLLSPSLYWQADRMGLPVVQTLHNFRLMCLNAMFLRKGAICQDCMGHLPLLGVVRACYRGHYAPSAVLGGMLSLHRAMGTYRRKVPCYIALNDFCREKFIESGLPAEKIKVKPNFVDIQKPLSVTRNGFLFVGRLSAEKGLSILAAAMARAPNARLRVVGDGPQADVLMGVDRTTCLGRRSGEEIRVEMNGAVALVVPSIWYETFGLVIIEAFACGTPVIASRIGALEQIVCDGETGLLFELGNDADLADKLNWALAHPEEMAEMGRRARIKYEAEFTPEINYQRLMEIYDAVLE